VNLAILQLNYIKIGVCDFGNTEGMHKNIMKFKFGMFNLEHVCRHLMLDILIILNLLLKYQIISGDSVGKIIIVFIIK
jgi:hypothetical protein